MPSARDLVSAAWQTVTRWYAWLPTRLNTVADIERRNRRNRNIAHQQGIKYETFSAAHTLAEARTIKQVDDMIQPVIRDMSRDQGLAALPAPKLAARSLGFRKLSAFELYRKTSWRQINQRMALWWHEVPGEARSERLKRFHAQILSQWDVLDESDRDHYDRLSGISGARAEAEKYKRRVDLAQHLAVKPKGNEVCRQAIPGTQIVPHGLTPLSVMGIQNGFQDLYSGTPFSVSKLFILCMSYNNPLRFVQYASTYSRVSVPTHALHNSTFNTFVYDMTYAALCRWAFFIVIFDRWSLAPHCVLAISLGRVVVVPRTFLCRASDVPFSCLGHVFRLLSSSFS